MVEHKTDPLVNYPPNPSLELMWSWAEQLFQVYEGFEFESQPRGFFVWRPVGVIGRGLGRKMGSTLPPAVHWPVCPSDRERVAVPLKFFMRLERFPAAAQYLLCCCQRLCNVRWQPGLRDSILVWKHKLDSHVVYNVVYTTWLWLTPLSASNVTVTVKLEAFSSIFWNHWWNKLYLSQENWVEMKILVQNNKDQNILGICTISPRVTVTLNGVWHATWSHNYLLACCVIILVGRNKLLFTGRKISRVRRRYQNWKEAGVRETSSKR